VLANRGASGIDGLVSTALGVAASGVGMSVALLGDLSFVHDVGGLLWNGRRGPDLTIVVVNNGGGTIFSFMGQRELPEHERLFVTPHDLDLGAICSAAGASHERIDRMRDLFPALVRAADASGISVVEIAVDANRNLAQHAEAQAAVDAALRSLG
jgi:2-succinyl-5-enolpyruvyl-6-hydroxy-3-cyclohexene-1-carboxylate synthase